MDQEIDLKEIYDATEEALEWVEKNNFDKARQEIEPIQESNLTAEVEWANSLVEARILLAEGKKEEAVEKIKNNLRWHWKEPYGLLIINELNPEVGPETICFSMTVTGSSTTLGFTENYTTTYQVLADSSFEAFDYIRKLGVYLDPELLRATETNFNQELGAKATDILMRRGVIMTSPFFLNGYAVDNFDNTSCSEGLFH